MACLLSFYDFFTKYVCFSNEKNYPKDLREKLHKHYIAIHRHEKSINLHKKAIENIKKEYGVD